MNDSVALSGEKDTELEKRNYLSGIVVFSAIYSFFLDLGSTGEEPVNLSLIVVPCKQQGTPVLVFRVYG